MLSDDVDTLLYHLRKRPLLGELLRDDPRRALLETLAGTNEWRAIPPLMPLIAADDALSPIAARTAARLLRGASPSQLAWIDAQARGYLAPDHSHRPWRELTAAAIPALIANLQPQWTAIGLLASHPNGYVRQTVVSELGGSHDGTEIPFLALRANDWVSDVSSAATALLAARLVPTNQAQVLESIPFIVRLFGQQRHNHERLADAFVAVLLGADFDLVQTGLRAVDTVVSRFVYSLLLAEAPTHHPILDAALGATDPGVRQAAVKKYGSRPGADVAARLIPLSRTDNAPGVRKEALSVVAERAPDSLRPLLPDLLLDRATRIRMLAQYLAGKLDSSLDVKALYRVRLSDQRRDRRAAAIAGLGETGTRDDATAVEALLGDDSPKIRRTALRAFARLGAERALPAAIAALEDPSGSVRTAAAAVVTEHRHRVDFNGLHGRWHQASDSNVRGGMLKLLAQAPKWDAVVYLLDALGTDSNNAALRELASRLLHEWIDAFNHSHLQPSHEHLQRIRAVLGAPTANVDPRAARFLGSIVEGR